MDRFDVPQLERDDVHKSATDSSRPQEPPISKADKVGYYLCGRVIFLRLRDISPTLSATPRFRACGGALKAGPANQQRLGVRYWHDVLGSAVKVTGVRILTFGKTRIRKTISPMRKVCVIHDHTSCEETSLNLIRNII